MGKPQSPRSPRPDPVITGVSFGMKDHQIRFSETVLGSDPSLGRRMLGGENNMNKTVMLHGPNKDLVRCNACKGIYGGKRKIWLLKHLRSAVFTIGIMCLLFLLDSLMFSNFDSINLPNSSKLRTSSPKEQVIRSSSSKVVGLWPRMD